MDLFLAELARAVPAGTHAALVLDGAGWHVSDDLTVPANLTLIHPPPYSPELEPGRPADSRAKRNRLSEADLHVLAKLLEQRLERGEEAEALPRRQVVREHDLLQLGIPERVEVEVPRQVAA